MTTKTHPLEKHFEPRNNGHFMVRSGPARKEGETVEYCNKKLCFTATDLPTLIEVLYELSNRPTCYFVKYSIKPRDGMHLGRCFFLDDDEVGETWAYYKNHPRMMCSIQDDDFSTPYRPAKDWK